jgi:S-adenosylmethionine-diacylglycerol 3-amino-3-carboxypropyl transferase
MSATTLPKQQPVKTRHLVNDAIGKSTKLGPRRLQDQLFAYLFRGLVYAQIWEDPVVDMAAMEIEPHHHIVTIASGGCNALSYLTAGPARVTAVDLNRAHVALLRLKIEGLKHLPGWEAFYRFFGEADDRENLQNYRHWLAPHLDGQSRSYWEGRNLSGRRRLSGFAKNIYRRGLLGKFIGTGHKLARFYGLDPQAFLACRTLKEQRQFFEEKISPLFDKKLVTRLTRSPVALFGLGIPPAQYGALAEGKPMKQVLKSRLEKLTCGFPLNDNYFAWQAFGRSYAPDASGPLPPYLDEVNYSVLRRNASRIGAIQANITQFLGDCDQGSVDRVVLLDAQDWMNDGQLNQLWAAISHAAAPRARVIFRTAGEADILPGRVRDELLSQWTYLEDRSLELHAQDRSSIYGGFHVYQLER